MKKRKLEDLNLLDDFLFGAMVSYPGIGEDFVRKILEVIFAKPFGKLTVVAQKVYPGMDTDMHGARLDVYIEENAESNSESAATVYDVEPDKNLKDIKNIPLRVRFYHAKIDAGSLKSGESYRMLKKVVVIMITPYDPFGLGHMVYTIRSKCEEIPDLPYDDGARTVFLYTKGTEGNPPKSLKQFLHYMEHPTEENAVTEALHSIHQMVSQVVHDKEVSLQYMKIFEREEMLVQQGIEQGKKEEQENTEREYRRAEQEKARAEQEKTRADLEKLRADRLEKEIIYLKRQINNEI